MAETYLYNGVELPELPEWDKETYPYAVIEYGTNVAGYHIANLIIAPSCTTGYSFGSVVLVYTDGYLFRQIGWYDTDGTPTTWGEPSTVTSSQNRSAEGTIWTSTDLYNTDGTLYLAASDPVPVVRTIPVLMPASMFQGLRVGRMIAMQRAADGSAVWAFMQGDTLILRAADSVVQTGDLLEVR